MTTKQISVFVENRPGSLAEFCDVLLKHDIDMRALCVADAMDFGIVRVIVDDTYKTVNVLKEANYIAQLTDVLAIEMDDKPGALGKVLGLLQKENINLEYTYAFLARQPGKAYFIMKVSNLEKASNALTKAGIRTIGQDEIESIFG